MKKFMVGFLSDDIPSGEDDGESGGSVDASDERNPGTVLLRDRCRSVVLAVVPAVKELVHRRLGFSRRLELVGLVVPG